MCSYHLQEAGATPVQELSYALATAIAVLERVRQSGEVDEAGFAEVVGRISFFVNAGMRFVTELAKMRAFVELWDEITRDRFGVADPSKRRFRYGVQVNSLGLTEQQPENNAYRILIEMLSVVLSRDARARAVQLPAWNEALGLPRPFDQQWSLRLQQIMAYETDLLDFGDIFDGSKEIAALVETLKGEALGEIASIDAMGGAVRVIETGVLKARLVESNTRRLEAIERGEQIVVGVNAFVNSEPSPLTAGEGSIMVPSAEAEAEQIATLKAWRAGRDHARVREALRALRSAAASGANIMPASIEAAKAGVTTGEWGDALRAEFGEFRAPTGVSPRARQEAADLDALRSEVERVSLKLGRRIKFLIGKPGLDGHSNGAEQVAARALDAGLDVVYDGIRFTPTEIAERAKAGVHCVGLSILSGSHVALTEEVLASLRAAGLGRIPVIVGGIIPPSDAERLKAAGVAAVYTPKDFEINGILAAIVAEVEARHDQEMRAGAILTFECRSPPTGRPRRRSASGHYHSAVGRQGRAGDETGVVGGQEHDAPSHLFRLAEAAHRNLGNNRLFEHVRRNGHDHFGRDIARTNRVDGNALAGVLLRQRLRETKIARLRGRIVGLAHLPLLAVDRRDVDDAAEVTLAHALYNRDGTY